MKDKAKPLFALDPADARRVEQLLLQRAAIEDELTVIFTRASGSTKPVQVVFGPSRAATFIVGGHTVGSSYVVTASGCGVYDIGDLVCTEIACDQVPQQPSPPPQ